MFFDRDGDFGGAGMPGDVGQAFLENPVNDNLGLSRKQLIQVFHLKGLADRIMPADLIDQIFQRRLQAQVF